MLTSYRISPVITGDPYSSSSMFSEGLRNLSTASNTRDNIHVNNDQQLESLHDLTAQLEGKLQSLRSVVKIAHGFESLNLRHVITLYHLAKRTIEPKFTFTA